MPQDRQLCVDGTDEYGNFAGDAQNAPFVVFDIDRQENIDGPYKTRAQAEVALGNILLGKTPQLDVVRLLRYHEVRVFGPRSYVTRESVVRFGKNARQWLASALKRASQRVALS